MKKQILLATIATLATSSVWATKARMNALGQAEDRGSFYIQDSRNVFRNPARINQMNNYVVTEWGTAKTGLGGSADPKAEGGFFKSIGTFSYGVYLGSDITDQEADTQTKGKAEFLSGVGASPIGAVFGDTGLKGRSNDLDLFVGGDMGIEWGARLHYAHGSQEQATGAELKQSTLGVGLGMVMGDLNAYVNYVLNDEMENSTAGVGHKWEDDGAMSIGAGYKFMNISFFFDYERLGGEYTPGSGVATNKTKGSVFSLGAGHIKEISSTSRVFSNASFRVVSAEDTNGTSSATYEFKTTALPVTIGFETDATSWLTLRGSISQNVLINSAKITQTGQAERKGSVDNTTSVSAGATLNFGKLMIDGMIGTNGNNGTLGASQGVLDTDRLLTEVAVHYWF